MQVPDEIAEGPLNGQGSCATHELLRSQREHAASISMTAIVEDVREAMERPCPLYLLKHGSYYPP